MKNQDKQNFQIINIQKPTLWMVLVFTFFSSFFAQGISAAEYTWDMGIASEYAQSELNATSISGGLGFLNRWRSNDIPGDAGKSASSTSGDYDNDGDIDIYVSSFVNTQNNLWINQGGAQGGVEGEFSNADIVGDMDTSIDAFSGDVDGDGDLDIHVTNTGQNKLWINDGNASFTAMDIPGDLGAHGTVMGDIDNDGDLDIHVTRRGGAQNYLWINQGGDQGGSEGQFLAEHIVGDNGDSARSSMGDVDGDGDIDIHVSNLSSQNFLWINQGGLQGGVPGNFLGNDIVGDTGTSPGSAMADFDKDGDLDIYVANSGQNRFWINQGGAQGGVEGGFAANNLPGDGSFSYGSAVADIDSDGDLDIYVGNVGPQNKLWINQGGAQGGSYGDFLNEPIPGDFGASYGIGQLRDFDGDGKVDVYIGNGGGGAQQNRLWLNGYSDSRPYIESVNGFVFTEELLTFDMKITDDTEGDVRLQVSSDNGLTWKRWNGSFWIEVTSITTSSTSSITAITENIATLDQDGGQFKWRAFLVSDGYQKVEIDYVLISEEDITTPPPTTTEPPYHPPVRSKKGCHDPEAINYSPIGANDPRICRYEYIFEVVGDDVEIFETEEGDEFDGNYDAVPASNSCPQFSQYMQFGDRDGEIGLWEGQGIITEVSKMQTFLNSHMGTSLVVDGVYGDATANAVGLFQTQYYSEIITPWTPELPDKITKKWYKTTRAKANQIFACAESAVVLEDTGELWELSTGDSKNIQISSSEIFEDPVVGNYDSTDHVNNINDIESNDSNISGFVPEISPKNMDEKERSVLSEVEYSHEIQGYIIRRR